MIFINLVKMDNTTNKIAAIFHCPDILLQIFSFFSRPKLCAIELVCWVFHRIVQSEHLHSVHQIKLNELIVQAPIKQYSNLKGEKNITIDGAFFIVVGSTLNRSNFDRADIIIEVTIKLMLFHILCICSELRI